MAGRYTAPERRLNGSMGFLQVNGTDWADIAGVQIQIDVEYEDIPMGLTKGPKLVSRNGTGTLSVRKAYTRSAGFIEELKAGKTPAIRIVAWVEDPDAANGQIERIAINQIYLTTIDVMTFTHGEAMKSEYPFRFDPDDLTYLDRVDPVN